MNKKKEIIKLMEMYNENSYSTDDFCELFSEMYYYENKGRDSFNNRQQKLLDVLANIVIRYSPYHEDIEKYPDTYYNKEKVREVFVEVFSALKDETT